MPFAWSKTYKKDGRPTGFEGRYYNRNAGINWSQFIPIENRPINYLEIGVADGGNAIHIANSYCKHPGSKIYCVDPWFDYDEYPEYKGVQDLAWSTFNKNIRNSGSFHKFIVNRGLSDSIVPTFQDEFFDIAFVDGNHETEYVYRDGVNAFNKVKSGGYIVFDDYSKPWPQTVAGINQFLEEYKDKINVLMLGLFNQAIIKKK